MSLYSKPLWFEGQLIRPQHLQQFGRWVEGLGRRFSEVFPEGWGIHGLELDTSSLGLGRVALQSCRAVMPDGMIVDMPGGDALPAPLGIPADAEGKLIKLALPMERPGQSELGANARFSQERQLVRDSAGGDREAELVIGRPNFRLIVEGQPEDELLSLPIARIRAIEASGAVTLSTRFIPPSLRLAAHRRLPAIAREIQAMLEARAEALARRVDPSRGGDGIGGMVEFALLQLINGSQPVFASLAAMPDAPPRELFWEMVRLAGALATFSRANRRPPSMPVWSHGAPAPVLDQMVLLIRETLGLLSTDTAVQLPLQFRNGGLWVSTITDRSLLSDATFVLTAAAAIEPERLRTSLPQQAKMGPAEAIRDLVNLQLPGLPLMPMPVAPREIPYRTGTVYFELGRQPELWRQLQSSAAFVLHVGTEVPDLRLEFWAIRKAGA